MARRQVAGVYAIHGPNGVYVGQSVDCWGRTTFQFALALGLDCGIVRELPRKSFAGRRRVETEVARIFARRGFKVVSHHAGRSLAGRYLAEHENAPPIAPQPAPVQ